MVKIKSYRLRHSGRRGVLLSLPLAWSDDLGLKPGDKLDVYRDEPGRLLILPPGVALPGKKEEA